MEAINFVVVIFLEFFFNRLQGMKQSILKFKVFTSSRQAWISRSLCVIVFFLFVRVHVHERLWIRFCFTPQLSVVILNSRSTSSREPRRWSPSWQPWTGDYAIQFARRIAVAIMLKRKKIPSTETQRLELELWRLFSAQDSKRNPSIPDSSDITLLEQKTRHVRRERGYYKRRFSSWPLVEGLGFKILISFLPFFYISHFTFEKKSFFSSF